MNDNNNHSFFSMMFWMMVICCAGPLILLFLAGRFTHGNLSVWLIVGVLVICVIGHFFMHRKHKDADHDPADEDKDNKLN